MNGRDEVESIHELKFEDHNPNNLRSFRQLFQVTQKLLSIMHSKLLYLLIFLRKPYDYK